MYFNNTFLCQYKPYYGIVEKKSSYIFIFFFLEIFITFFLLFMLHWLHRFITSGKAKKNFAIKILINISFGDFRLADFW